MGRPSLFRLLPASPIAAIGTGRPDEGAGEDGRRRRARAPPTRSGAPLRRLGARNRAPAGRRRRVGHHGRAAQPDGHRPRPVRERRSDGRSPRGHRPRARSDLGRPHQPGAIADRVLGGMRTDEAGGHVVSQVVGAIAGTVLANLMFDLPAVEWSSTVRSRSHLWLGRELRSGARRLLHRSLRPDLPRRLRRRRLVAPTSSPRRRASPIRP